VLRISALNGIDWRQLVIRIIGHKLGGNTDAISTAEEKLS
jgi:hypothetical protein